MAVTKAEGVVPFQCSGGINVPNERLIANVETNIRRGYPQAQPYEPNDKQVLIAAGGPSLETCLGELKEQVAAGVKAIAVNGTLGYLLDHGGITPSMFVMLDARPENARFVARWREAPRCKFFIASQCDPAVFDALRGAEVYIYHCDLAIPRLTALLDRFYFGKYYEVPGGSTVTLRAIMLLRMLGFKKIDIYGLDACMEPGTGRHHPYEQPQNAADSRTAINVTVKLADGAAEKVFRCAPWMAKQADEFKDMVKHCGGLFELNVHGDGLIAWMIKAGAEIAAREAELEQTA